MKRPTTLFSSKSASPHQDFFLHRTLTGLQWWIYDTFKTTMGMVRAVGRRYGSLVAPCCATKGIHTWRHHYTLTCCSFSDRERRAAPHENKAKSERSAYANGTVWCGMVCACAVETYRYFRIGYMDLVNVPTTLFWRPIDEALYQPCGVDRVTFPK